MDADRPYGSVPCSFEGTATLPEDIYQGKALLLSNFGTTRMKHTCFLLILMSNALFGQVISKTLETELQRRVALEINPGISIGVLYPDGTTGFFGYGSFDDRNKQPDSLTLYEIGSVTKTFTASLTDIYLQDSLKTPLSSFFPGIGNPDLGRITPSDLRNHVAGVPRLSDQFAPENWTDPFNGYSAAVLKEELRLLSPDSSGVWSYSNLGYGILGQAIEMTTNKSYEVLMGSLLQKAGMEATFLKIPTDEGLDLAQPTNIGTANSNWNFTGPSRYAGGLVSNAKDLLNYLKYQKQTNPLFGPDPVQHLIPTGVPDLGKDKLFYKDGWFVLQPDQTTQILMHNGGTGGFISFIGYNKNTGLGVVVLSNSVTVVDDIGIHMMYPAFQLNHPERTIAYELAEAIDAGNTHDLLAAYQRFKREGYPQNIIAVYWLERFHFGKGNYPVSKQLSEIMVQELPDDWEVHDIKGQNLEQLGQYREAIMAYEKALSLNPQHQGLHEKIARCASMIKE